ncbi:MAG: hypothetical protein ABJA78_05785 [Ferruginibacter sp.]
MKQMLSIIIFFCNVTAVSAQYASAKPMVIVKEGNFSINNITVSDQWPFDPLKELFHSAGRHKGGLNVRHIYDSLGIVLLEERNDTTPSGTISEAHIYFQLKKDNDVTPSHVFTGSFKVENMEVSSKLSKADISSQLKDYTEAPHYIPHTFRFSYKGIYLYFHFNNTDTQVTEVSIGPDKTN